MQLVKKTINKDGKKCGDSWAVFVWALVGCFPRRGLPNTWRSQLLTRELLVLLWMRSSESGTRSLPLVRHCPLSTRACLETWGPWMTF